MKKLLIVFITLPVLCGVFIFHSKPAAAVNNNYLIDDATFDNTNTLSAAQIDNWLNSNFPSSCISTNSGFSAPDPIGYMPFYPHTDGKYLYGGPVSAGQVVYDAAKAHQINPQVLLTKLQNEEGLVVGNGLYGCGATALAAAVGYACTDSGTFTHDYTYTGADPFTDSTSLPTPLYYRNGVAVNSVSGNCVNHNVFAGFSEQVVHSAWALSIWRHKSEGLTNWAAINGNWNHCDDINTCPGSMNIPSSWACYSGYMTQGTFKRCPTDSTAAFYDGFASISGTSIHMDSGATAALYVYTPHIQSFNTIFSGWFGSPTSPCQATSNVSGALSGFKILPYTNAPGTTNLAFTQINNSGSACAEVHIDGASFNNWIAHIATGMRATDPTGGTFVASKSTIDSRESINYINYIGGGKVEVHRFSPDLQKFPGYYDVGTNLSNVTPTSGVFVAGDFFGVGYDQLAYIIYSNGTGRVEVHLFDPSLTRAVGYYDLVTDVGGASDTAGTFVAGDFLGRGYSQLAYVTYGNTEVHLLDIRGGRAARIYEVPTNLSGASASAGTFVAGDFLGRGSAQLLYVIYSNGQGRVETHMFNPSLTKVTGTQDLVTNIAGFNTSQ